jgi:excisionase family DNA binding protein
MERKVLGFQEVAAMAGVEITTVYQWVYLRKIPFVKRKGRRTYFLRADIEEWIGGGADKGVGNVER